MSTENNNNKNDSTDEYVDLTYGEFQLKPNVAIFDLDDTVITMVSNKKFPIDEHDWKFINNNVKTTLANLYNDRGFCIVIISNQKGLAKNRETQWVAKLNAIAKQLNIPLKVYAAKHENKYRKPIPTFFDIIKSKININFTTSFFCGDACGRPGDYADTDLKFALNCGLAFRLPEDVFGSVITNLETLVKNIDYPVLEVKNTTDINILQPLADSKEKLMIILTAYQGSGKSYLCDNVFTKFVRISMDDLRTKDKCIKTTKVYLAQGDQIIIDNTNPDSKSRYVYIMLAKKYNYKIASVYINCSEALAIHNIKYRMYMQEKNIPLIALKVFTKNFEKPAQDEGFDTLVEVTMNITGPKYKLFYS